MNALALLAAALAAATLGANAWLWTRREAGAQAALVALAIGALAGATSALFGVRVSFALALASSCVLAPARDARRLAAVVAAGVVASLLSPAIGIAALATITWVPSPRRRDDVVLVAALLVAVVAPWDAGWSMRADVALVLAASGLLSRRALARQAMGAGGRRIVASIAAFVPLLSLIALLALDARFLKLAPDAVGRAGALALFALVGALATALVFLGAAIVLSTRNDARGPLVGLTVGAAVAGLALGTPAVLLLALPAALGLGVGAAVLVPPAWRAGRAWARATRVGAALFR